jgi:two-component system invasion response regulator UvrY
MIRVLIADDHAVVRRGVRQILEAEPDIEVIGEAGEYGEIRRRLKDLQCDVLILDVQMPGKNGLEVVKNLRDEIPRLAVLMLSTYPEDQYAVRALKAGARGYITKTTAPERIVEAVRTVSAGRKFISAETAEALAATVSGERVESPHTTLSDREFQILKLIASGKKLADIATALALSPKTVSVYRARILEKMSLTSNAELTHYALKNALVE